MAVSIGVVSVIVTLSAILTYFLAKILRVFHLISKFDGPPALPIVGNAHLFHQDAREFFMQIEDWVNEYRPKSNGRMRLWLGPVPVCFTFNCRDFEVVMSSSRHIKKGYVYTFLHPWLGRGLLTSTGQKWFHRRKLLTPTFHFSILQNFMDVFNEQSFIMAKKMEKFADQSEPFNIFPQITYCVLDIICDTAMGKSINAQGEGDNEYVTAVISMTNLVQERMKKPWFWPDLLYDNIQSGKKHANNLRVLHDMTTKIIKQRLQEPPRALDGSEEDAVAGKRRRIAFLDLLLQMHREDPSFTLEDIREEVDTFMFEGHDTTAAAASWTILMIGRHPEVQTRLHEELDEVFGDSDRPITADDLQKLQYLNCVFKETLRLCPSVPMIGRDLEEDCVIDGKVVPKGTLVVLGIYALHRDPEQFPDPEKFDPDRFLLENSTKRHPYAYVPFSAGPRNCIGQKFAMMEDKVILANLMRKFSVQAIQTMEETNPLGELIMRPRDGIYVKLSRRK
ncbi:cytochrome P450 4V2 isoform X1 [Strongylocentrotus purpuratus]|uniref:Cytochrome P450 n=2 Tax=Strongylocentrotus purpuratus TaxID=7668 RepID=A0A7M7NFC2_STRPU|nr:cytochrome P450 4V2 isoform X1 [Strongylocentrotus purpuratus]XP_030835601.1 cytochrome P450 4V2 isoform X1 [Strongylocentrotus purpuratus]XP_030835602.1 cytochrome P450 4V2 isoform X1 [Strongylocentrotus purpuratus]